jgi:ADP-ribose pyrophosphatase YjhB (NUDIX family)
MEKRRVNVRAIVHENGKILAVKHKSDDGGESSYWALPGGGLDPMESLPGGVARELMEETGVQAEVGKLLFIQQFPSERAGWDEELELFFAVTNAAEFHRIDLANTSHGQEEITRIAFIDPAQENILPEFLQTVDIAAAVKVDGPVQVYDYL